MMASTELLIAILEELRALRVELHEINVRAKTNERAIGDIRRAVVPGYRDRIEAALRRAATVLRAAGSLYDEDATAALDVIER